MNLLYGRTGLLDPRSPRPGERDRRHVEHQLFPGFVSGGVGSVRLRASPRDATHGRGDQRRRCCSLAWCCRRDPRASRRLYAALHDNVYGFQAIRAPGAIRVIAMLGMAMLAALGMQSLSAKPPAEPGPPSKGLPSKALRSVWPPAKAGGFVVALLCLEYLNAPLPLAAASAAAHRGRAVARAASRVPARLLHVPLAIDIENTTVHGAVARAWPPDRQRLQRSAPRVLLVASSTVWLTCRRQPRLRRCGISMCDSSSAARRSPAPGTNARRWSSGRGSATASSTSCGGHPRRWRRSTDLRVPPPPPPGPAPFAAGEVVTYDVYWDGGPMNIPAGTATLTVQSSPEGGPGWTFETRADDGQLGVDVLPGARSLHHRRGSRPASHSNIAVRSARAVASVDRRYLYDRAARTVQTAEMTLPLGATTPAIR